MAIIENSCRRLLYYPFQAIEQSAATMLLQIAANRQTLQHRSIQAVQLFECFSDLTGENINLATLTSPVIFRIFGRFCGALSDRRLTNFSRIRRADFCRELGYIIQEVRTTLFVDKPFEWDYKKLPMYEKNWKLNPAEFEPDKIAYWMGWPIHNREGDVVYLNLSAVWNSHGKKFTDTLHSGISLYCEGAVAPPHHYFSKMFNFMVNNAKKWPAKIFQDPNKLYDFFFSLLLSEFNGVDENDSFLPNKKKSWNKFIGLIYRIFIHSRKWATPYRHLPLTDAKAINGHHTHVRKTATGIHVRAKLITPIPVHLTERAAVEMLILQILEEIRIIRAWASEQSTATVTRFENRKFLAMTANNTSLSDPDFSINDFPNHLAVLFERDTYNADFAKVALAMRSPDRGFKGLTPGIVELTRIIGIPNTRDMYPFQCMLILEHPCITNKFLERFELYDKNGDLTGFISEGGKSYLACELESRLISGIKGRKGMNKGRQKYELTSTAAKVMHDVIKITTPARNYLRSVGDENWKKLFIASSLGISHPVISKIPRWNNTTLHAQFNFIIPQFHCHTGMREDTLLNYLRRISPTTIRASRCIEEYLKNGSTRLVGESLGHEQEDTALLESYIPRALMNFIESNSIIKVQKVAICYALRDSPFLVTGSGFDNLDDLAEFVNHNTFGDLPEYLTNPDYLNEEISELFDQELLIRLSIGSLTALLSIQAAVLKAKDTRGVSLDASRWAQLAGYVVADIEAGRNQRLKEKLVTARLHADPGKMEGATYE